MHLGLSSHLVPTVSRECLLNLDKDQVFHMADALTKVIDATHFIIFRDFILVVIKDEVIAALKRND